MKITTIALCLCLLSLSSYARSSDKDLMKEISTEASNKFITCAAYFEIAQRVMAADDEAKKSNVYLNSKKEALDYAIEMAKMAFDEKKAQRNVNEKFKIVVSDISSKANKEQRNQFAIWIKKKADYCPKLMKDPSMAIRDL